KRAGTEEIVEVPDYLYLGEAMEIGPVAKIDARDRAWLEVYGLRWPEPKHEAAWLKEVNEQLALSSASAHRVEGATVGARIEQKDAIVKARHFMLDLLPALAGAKEDILAHSRSRNSLVAGDHMLGVLRMFSNVEGIAKQIAQTGMILTRTTSTITRNMLGTEKLGFNVKRVLDSGGVATFSSFSPEAIAERLQPMYTALRVWGVPNYKEVVHAYIERQPVIINYRSDKTRLIARILSSLVTRTDIGDSVQAKLISLYAAPAVNLAHAYSETQGPVSFEAFMAKVRKNINADRSALLWELLQKDSGDPVTKILLRSWPVRDPEALRWAYDRHKRATGRRREHIDLEWQGRAALGDEATDAAYEAFRRATESPPLSAEELDELDRRIRLGSIASKHIEVLRRAAPLEPFEDAELETTAAKGVAARKALVVRHLGMVIAYADYRKYGAEIQAEIAATANLHLVKAAAAYDPQAGKSFADVADEAISMALSLPRLHPKGYSVNDDAAA
ncbi:MAG TPA: hypothetical protein VD735_03555, partial [Candidatus Saccharimonadales bacterium]|nr:hypothetical protein [Candidatus Saccharimonadales bacterium]